MNMSTTPGQEVQALASMNHAKCHGTMSLVQGMACQLCCGHCNSSGSLKLDLLDFSQIFDPSILFASITPAGKTANSKKVAENAMAAAKTQAQAAAKAETKAAAKTEAKAAAASAAQDAMLVDEPEVKLVGPLLLVLPPDLAGFHS